MNKKQKAALYRILLALALIAGIKLSGVKGWAEAALYLAPYLIVGGGTLKKAVKGILKRQVFDENFLMAVATVGAMALGDYLEGCAVMVFYQIGELFESYAVGKSRKNISELMDIRPDYAMLEHTEGIRRVDPEEVEVGSIILVEPGERIPIDGEVVQGSSTLNTSALTGESLPREVKPGDAVISGCVNMSGVLRIRTTREFGESTVAKILELVENSSMKKAKAENFITKFARYYTPAVCYGALALALLPPLGRMAFGLSGDWGEWVTRALTFLVISCPCALVISIPLSFFGGIGGASRRGILIKGSNYMEVLSSARCVVFDKTGTLTEGVFQVTKLAPAPGVTEERLLEYAALAECHSHHPISQSLRTAYGREIESGRVSEVEELGGHGVTATVDGVAVAAGNERLMTRLGVSCPAPEGVGTVIHVAIDGRYAGYILISDVVKPTAKAALRSLKESGVKKTVMLTGDGKAVAEGVARELGVDEVYSELLPGDKVEQVERLLAQCSPRESLAFVGDGINDAPVLSRADVGIAMGALGSDAAIEAADIVLMDDDPAKLALAMRIARRTLGIVYQNIVFALAVKAACLVLGALGVANMWLAIFADVGVMVIAVLNATRALATKDL